jgi:GTPase
MTRLTLHPGRPHTVAVLTPPRHARPRAAAPAAAAAAPSAGAAAPSPPPPKKKGGGKPAAAAPAEEEDTTTTTSSHAGPDLATLGAADRAAMDAAAAALADRVADAELAGSLDPLASDDGDAGSPSSTSPTTLPLRLLPKVAIVGRPNVGKSALFNRLVGARTAIVHDFPGVTRDRLYARAHWAGREFAVIDTGGLMADAAALPDPAAAAAAAAALSADGLPSAIERQAAAGVGEADAVLVVADGTAGLTAADAEVLAWLRRRHPDLPVLLAANKCDNSTLAATAVADLWASGMEPWPVSAISGTGTGDLLDALLASLPSKPRSTAGGWGDGGEESEDNRPLAVAIVGRPNAGKSSLLNALVGSERAIVSPLPGTTRDAIDCDVAGPDGRRYRLVDTAGVRKRAAVAGSADGAEPLSVARALAAIRRADVVALVLDAAACTQDGRFVATLQDYRLAELIGGAGKGAVVVLNKWDAVPGRGPGTVSEYEAEVRAALRPIEWAAITHASAATGRRVGHVLAAAAAAGDQHGRRLSTATLNLVIREAVGRRPPPAPRGLTRRGRVYYATQPSTRPPTFVLFVNDPALFPDEYRRYVERAVREAAGFDGTALRVLWRGKEREDGGSGGGDKGKAEGRGYGVKKGR